jgi:hypothetical protein
MIEQSMHQFKMGLLRQCRLLASGSSARLERLVSFKRSFLYGYQAIRNIPT